MRSITRLFLFIMVATVCLSGSASAYQAWELLKSHTSTGPGPSAYVGVKDEPSFTRLDCDILVTGSPTYLHLLIEGNQGGNSSLFDSRGKCVATCLAEQLSTGICSFSCEGWTAQYLRANVITLEGGTSPTVSLYCTPSR